MAVPKKKPSRSKKKKRCSQDKIKIPYISIDTTSKETHLRHFITYNGYYKGKLIIKNKILFINK